MKQRCATIKHPSRVIQDWLNAWTKTPRPDWDDIRGIAPDSTGDKSSETFVRDLRDEWGNTMGTLGKTAEQIKAGKDA